MALVPLIYCGWTRSSNGGGNQAQVFGEAELSGSSGMPLVYTHGGNGSGPTNGAGSRSAYHWLAPDGEGPFPAVILNHGGFQGITPAFLEFARKFRDAGFAVFAPEYRGQGEMPGAREFAKGEVDDVLRVLDAVRQRDDVDPERIAMYGVSHGGTITLLALSRGADVRAAVVQSSISDVNAMLAVDKARRILEIRNVQFNINDPEEVDRRNPIKHLDGIRGPLLILHGANDPLVPAIQARRLEKELRRRGVDTELEVYPGAEHNLKELESAWSDAFDFLRRQLQLD